MQKLPPLPLNKQAADSFFIICILVPAFTLKNLSQMERIFGNFFVQYILTNTNVSTRAGRIGEHGVSLPQAPVTYLSTHLNWFDEQADSALLD